MQCLRVAKVTAPLFGEKLSCTLSQTANGAVLHDVALAPLAEKWGSDVLLHVSSVSSTLEAIRVLKILIIRKEGEEIILKAFT